MSALQNNRRLPIVYGSLEHPVEDARLPKTMPHWFREFGITFDAGTGHGYARRRELKIGCGEPLRRFRALPNLGLLQICDGYFDRWANSVGAEVPLPKSRIEFVAAMQILLAEAKLAKIDPAEEIDRLSGNIAEIEKDIAKLHAENADLAYNVRFFGRTSRWIRVLWKRYQWDLKNLEQILRRKKGYLKYQKTRLS